MEDALLKNLFQGYQRWVRPIQRNNDTIKVRFGLKISQLVDVVRRHTRTYKQTDISLQLLLKVASLVWILHKF